MPSAPEDSPDRELIKAFQAAGVIDYLQYLQSSRKIMWTNFLAGVMKGFGLTIGATVLIGIFIWVLTQLVSLPFIGEYFQKVEAQIEEYAEKTNYADDFEEMNRLLEEINDNLKQAD